MDLEEFEKQAEKQSAEPEKPRRYGCGAAGSATGHVSGGDGNGILDQLEEWERYMQFGMAGFRQESCYGRTDRKP